MKTSRKTYWLENWKIWVPTIIKILNVSDTFLRKEQTLVIISAISDGSKLTKLDISKNDLSGIDPRLLSKSVTRLVTLGVSDTKLDQHQVMTILLSASEESKLANLYISANN